MITTITPMLAEPSLVGLMTVLVLAIFMVIAIPGAVIAIVLLLRGRNRTPQQIPPSGVAAQPAASKRALWILLGFLVVAGGGTILAVVMHNKTSAGDRLQPR